jgi:FMN phosphatase YigB (HAD superfamily)
MKSKIRAVSFDFWNTLFRDQHGAAYQEMRLKLFMESVRSHGECCEEDVLSAFKHCAETCNRIWSEEYRTPTARERIEMVLAQLALELPDEVLDPLAQLSGEILYQFPPTLIDDALEVLGALVQDYKLAVISDTGFAPGRVLREIMKRHDIYDFFDVTTFSDEAGRSKPHESIFLRTTEALDISPEEMLHIGDLELTDVAGAKGVGATAVLFAENGVSVQPSRADYIVKSHLELLSVLEKIVP